MFLPDKICVLKAFVVRYDNVFLSFHVPIFSRGKKLRLKIKNS